MYELRHEHGKTSGATQIEILNHMQSRGWPVPASNIDRVLSRMIELARAEIVRKTDSITTTRYALTTDGELEDEILRRAWLLRVFDELKQPPTAAKVVIGGAGLILGIVVQRLASALLH